MSEGSAYTDFTTCIIIPRHIRKRLGSCVGRRKRRSLKLSVSQGKEEHGTALNYHQLTEVNPPFFFFILSAPPCFVKSHSGPNRFSFVLRRLNLH